MSTVNAKRVLLISYAFPPTGGAGVQRAAKFVKFLPQFGWQATVLTVANPSVPVRDDSLLRDIPQDTCVLRAVTWEPGYRVKSQLAAGHPRLSVWRALLRRATAACLQPDPQILWHWAALRLAQQHLRREPHQALLVTAPPFSSCLLGRRLKKQLKLPLILDFRDEWSLVSQHLENHQPGLVARLRQTRMKGSVLRSADALIATTQRSARALENECRQVHGTARAQCIYNGYDPEDLPLAPVAAPQPDTTALRMVYIGTLWNLTDIAPCVAALKLLPKQVSIELHVAGRRLAEQDRLLQELQGSSCRVLTYDYLSHDQALTLAASADVLLLTLSDVPGAERVVPAKLFEYLGLRKRILAVAPDGEVSELLTTCPLATVFHPQQTRQISAWLAHAGTKQPSPADASSSDYSTQAYSRLAQAQQLAQLLEQCATVASR